MTLTKRQRFFAYVTVLIVPAWATLITRKPSNGELTFAAVLTVGLYGIAWAVEPRAKR